MPRQAAFPFLAEFEAWLQDQGGLKVTSAHTYRAYVSAILNLADDPGNVESVCDALRAYEGVAAISGYKAAWTHFCYWAEKHRGVRLASPFTRCIEYPLARLPNTALELAACLKEARLPIVHINQLRWGMIPPEGSADALGYRVAHPTRPGIYIMVPMPTLDDWRKDWPAQRSAEELGNPYLFVFPRGTDFTAPYPVRALRSQLDEYMRSTRAPPPLNLPYARGTSALGVNLDPIAVAAARAAMRPAPIAADALPPEVEPGPDEDEEQSVPPESGTSSIDLLAQLNAR
jgi:hypothetical protein